MTIETMPLIEESGSFEAVGQGLNVYTSDEVVEGRAKWLDSPDDVISFVESGEDVSDVIVIARGGTTTFLAMALNAGVRGVLTLQGAPESHLGILSREYGIPCIMSVAFDRGVRTSRGETIPADGVRLRMDVSARPHGTVAVESGAPVDDSPAGESSGPVMTAEQMAQIQALLANFKGDVPPGNAGDVIMQQRLNSNVLDLDDPTFDRELTVDETNDFIHYLAWNEWDALASRATEGESGLIPRQEYEAMGIMDCWFHHPEWLKAIQDRVGPDGLKEIGARAQTEIGTKINMLHIWALASASSFGRGISLELNLHDFDYRTSEITETVSSVRRLYKGLWGAGPIFTSMKDYQAPVLDRSWITRFEQDRLQITEDLDRSIFQRFNGATELLGFLLHFDNRLGLGDSGPYPTDDGGFVIVRDLFINEPVYEWSKTTEGLPYAVTIAMFFDGDSDLETKVLDLSTMFTEPSNYLPFVKGVSVYSREKFDTPMEDLKTLSFADMAALRERVERSSEVLYKYIAAMSEEEKVNAGAVVYSSGFMLPFARAAGMFDELVEDYGLMSIHPVPNACHETIVGGVATEMIPRLFLTGSWANDVPPQSRDEPEQLAGEAEVLHAIRVRGFASVDQIQTSTGLPAALIQEVLASAEDAGHLKQRTGRITGARLTPVGKARLLLISGVALTDGQQDAISSVYKDFLAPNRDFKALTSRWQTEHDLASTTTALDQIHQTVVAQLQRAASAVSRFDLYVSRLEEAKRRFDSGEEDALAKPLSESYHDIWMELHEDLLATLGRERNGDDE